MIRIVIFVFSLGGSVPARRPQLLINIIYTRRLLAFPGFDDDESSSVVIANQDTTCFAMNHVVVGKASSFSVVACNLLERFHSNLGIGVPLERRLQSIVTLIFTFRV